MGNLKRKKPQSYLHHKRTWKSQTPDPKDSLWCTNLKKKRQKKETCWDIHGRPKNLGKIFVTYEEADQESTQAPALDLHQLDDRRNYNLSELERIKSVIQYLNQGSSAPSSSPVVGATSLANIGKCLQLKHISKAFNDLCNSWILDSGATNHMTFDSKNFITYNLCPSN